MQKCTVSISIRLDAIKDADDNTNAELQTTDEFVEQLMAKRQSYIEKSRKLGNHRYESLKAYRMNIDKMEFVAWMERIMDEA